LTAQHDALADAHHHLHLVFDQHHRALLHELLDEVHHHLVLRGSCRGGLVHQQQLRFGRQSHGNLQRALLPMREF
jgi:hypothetical protein